METITEDNVVVRMPPKKRYPVEMEIMAIKKAEPTRRQSMDGSRRLEAEVISEGRLEEARKRMMESQNRLEKELREMRRKAPYTHKEDHQVVINI